MEVPFGSATKQPPAAMLTNPTSRVSLLPILYLTTIISDEAATNKLEPDAGGVDVERSK
jgi:hypothetical protein